MVTMTLPPDLEKTAREMAEDHIYKQPQRMDARERYLFGFRACYEHLCTMGPEFDQMTVAREGIAEMKRGVATDSAYIRGARTQHSLMSAQIAARDARIKELEAKVVG